MSTLYKLSPAATQRATLAKSKILNTKQLPTNMLKNVHGTGNRWASSNKATTKPNTRVLAFKALSQLGPKFTKDQALKALVPIVKGTSGTPASYFNAFTKGKQPYLLTAKA